MYLLSLTAATRTIRIANAYFVPDDLTVATLVAARQRGVAIDILLPGRHSDSVLVRRASRARWGRLLEAGVGIYEYLPTMYHCKVMVVDECWTSVGSTNFDSRSFRLNDEANLNVLDQEFAAGEIRQFTRDLAQARRVTFEAWRARPWREKAVEHLTALLRSQL
jgi:cardiolipin synthase